MIQKIGLQNPFPGVRKNFYTIIHVRFIEASSLVSSKKVFTDGFGYSSHWRNLLVGDFYTKSHKK